MKTKLNPNTIVLLSIFLLSIVANIILEYTNANSYDVLSASSKIFIYAIFILKIILFVFIGFKVKDIIKKVILQEQWNEAYYANIKIIGWLSVGVLFFDSVLKVIKDTIFNNEAAENVFLNNKLYSNALIELLFGSPASWLFVLCIFITADVLKLANEKNQ